MNDPVYPVCYSAGFKSHPYFVTHAGVLSIALPVPVVVSNFEQFYQKELNRRRQEKDKRDEEKRKEKQKKRLSQGGGLLDDMDGDEMSSMMGNGEKRPANV